jgi:hypothetical protein
MSPRVEYIQKNQAKKKKIVMKLVLKILQKKVKFNGKHMKFQRNGISKKEGIQNYIKHLEKETQKMKNNIKKMKELAEKRKKVIPFEKLSGRRKKSL